MKIIRAYAPLRLGLAGGGSDVSPFCDIYGGLVLNATINLYATCTIIPENSGNVTFEQSNGGTTEVIEAQQRFDPTGPHSLAKAVYNRIVNHFNRGQAISHRLITSSDAPPGSGLGSSSALIVAMLQAYTEFLNLPLSEYDIASLAYEVERIDLGQRGGHQDQYAAAFGGINFMEISAADRVLVNPLRVKDWILAELEQSIMLFYTSVSRYSSAIIDEQVKTIEEKNTAAVEATSNLKTDALAMKEALLMGRIRRVADILGSSWEAKKRLAKSISNEALATVIEVAKNAGAYSGKVSGAGGGGFVMIMLNPLHRASVAKALKELPGYVVPFQFVQKGAYAWTVTRGVEGAI